MSDIKQPELPEPSLRQGTSFPDGEGADCDMWDADQMHAHYAKGREDERKEQALQQISDFGQLQNALEENSRLREELSALKQSIAQPEAVVKESLTTEILNPQPQEDADIPDAIRLLGLLFDGWESGHPCYADPDNDDEYLGSAFRISDELFDECCNLLNRRNPPRGTVLKNGMLVGSQPAQEPCGWLQFIEGRKTQNFARDESELKNLKEMATLFAGTDNVKYIPVYYAPTAQPPAQAAVPKWCPIETAPKDRSILLAVKNTSIPIYCGRKRYGNMGEPQQDEFAWRCDSSGRFTNPTHWMPLPAAPEREGGV